MPGEASQSEGRDLTGYVFADTRQRRITAIIFWALAGGAALLWLMDAGGAGWASGGLLAGSIVVAVIGVHFWVAGKKMGLDHIAALTIATKQVDFAVGQTTTDLIWQGLWSRPVWHIVLFSTEDPPTMRGMVELDAVDGRILACLSLESEPQ